MWIRTSVNRTPEKAAYKWGSAGKGLVRSDFKGEAAEADALSGNVMGDGVAG